MVVRVEQVSGRSSGMRAGFCLLAAGLMWAACGDDAKPAPLPENDGSTAADGVGSDGADSDGESADGETADGSDGAHDGGSDAGPADQPILAAQCEGTAVRCRGACFQTPGQAREGCELLFLRSEDHDSVTGARFDDQSAFVASMDRADGNYFDLHHVDLATGEVTLVYNDGGGNLERTQVHDGALHVMARHEWSPGRAGITLQKLTKDGQRTPVAGAMSRFIIPPVWDIADGFVYYADTHENDSNRDIYRLPVGARLDSPFYLGTEEGGELVVADVSVNALAVSGSYVYYIGTHVDAGLYRVKIGEPNSATLLSDAYSALSELILPPSDPEHVYFHEYNLLQLPRTGGTPVELFGSLNLWFSTEQVLTYGEDGEEDRRFRARSYLTPELAETVDHDGSEVITAWETPEAYYAVSINGLMRIRR